MDFGQVLRKARVACFNSGQRSEDHFVDVAEMVPRRRQLGPKGWNVKCVGVPLYGDGITECERCERPAEKSKCHIAEGDIWVHCQTPLSKP